MLTREENFYDKVWVELWSDLTQLGVYESVESPPCGFVTVIPDSPKSA